MKSSWLVGAITLMIGIQMVIGFMNYGAPITATSYDADGNPTGRISAQTIQQVMSISAMDLTNPVTAIVSGTLVGLTTVWGIFKLIINALAWNYPNVFTPGVGEWIKYLVFYPLSAVLTIGFINTLRGVSAS